MKYLKLSPEEDTYIDGRLVVDYRVLATREEIREAYTRGNSHNRGQKPVYQYDQGKSLVGIYSSITEAASETGCSRTHIGQVLDNEDWSSGGFLWKSEMR